jgi:hypothetical protein
MARFLEIDKVHEYKRRLLERQLELAAVPARGGSGTRTCVAEELDEIKHALASIENGTYGVCSRCAEPIGMIRLNAVPDTRLCVLCAFAS